ncbi:MAG: RagB/SusD family nutrient uptake outer membrane protein [Paludibacter sp.]|nr:RagB/SusD family nutrient uptake outer membrane protein [Paludibacter sp.]
MKKTLIIKKVFTVCISVLLISSCDLNELPQSSISPENSFKNETELKLYINGLLPMLSGSTIEKVDNGIESSLPSYMIGLRSSTLDAGSWSWGNLRKINIFLKYSQNCPDEKVKAKYDAMAYYLRAQFYYEKLKTFGGVPYYDFVLDDNSPELYNSRDTREMVADKILQDIDKAITNGVEDKKINEITKWTSLALKSRFCLFEGTYRKYHNIAGYEKFLQECVLASEELMTSGKYSIDASGGNTSAYRDLFVQPNTQDANNKEVINAEAYSKALGVKHGLNYTILNTAGGKIGLEKSLIDSYLMTDGSRFTDQPGYATKTFKEEFQNRDPRLTQTVRGPGYIRVGESTANVSNLIQAITHSTTGYMPIKYFSSSAYDAQNANENDIIVYRYAEVLLNFAEAKAELGTLSQNDIDLSIKLIRNRVGMPNLNMVIANSNPDPVLSTQYPLVSGSNKGVILEIRRERRIEMVMEGLRYDDLMRWKAGHLFIPQFKGVYFSGEGGYDLDGDNKNDIYLYTGNKPSIAVLGGATAIKLNSALYLSNGSSGNIVVNTEKVKSWNEERDYLAPIPNSALVINPNLEQNPYWDSPNSSN